MQHLKLSFFSLLALGGTIALTGCSGFNSFDLTQTPSTVTMTTGIKGSNFGGHAPIVGAKVFLLQAGQTGYGSKATSLLTSAAGGTDTTIVGSPGSPAYYTTTDSSGQFSLTGNYTCTSGLPVYVYAYAGAPDTSPSVGPSNLISGSGSSASGNLVLTYTVDVEKFYVGQQVTFSGIPAGNLFAGNNGVTFTVTAVSTTDNKSFSVTAGPSSTNIAATPVTGQVTPVGVQNPAIVNTAMLGNCPSPFTISATALSGQSNFLTNIAPSVAAKLAIGDTISGPGVSNGTITYVNVAGGTIVLNVNDTVGDFAAHVYTVSGSQNNFGPSSSSAISYIYMNEVSTAASMFAMAPFAETSTISSGVVTRTSTDAQHIGIPASNTLALTGLQNAAVNAGQLYDITGGNVATGCNVAGQCANGEAHVARLVVPSSGVGQGVATVPQSLIDTLGNILASCVDSANTYGLGATGGSASSACTKLFETATNNGVPVSTLGATTPTDIATAAINIAHYPAGNGSNAGAFMSNLFSLQTGVVPFVPNLSTVPTDFVIGINITVPQGSNPTNYLGSSFTSGQGYAAIPTAIATNANGEAFIGTTGCGNGTAVESATNGYGCILQIEPNQLLPALPTVGGVGLAQGVKSISLGPTGKVWATGTLETGQSVGGYTPPAGAFYIAVNSPSSSTPITYGTANGALTTSYNFASFGNTQVGAATSNYTQIFGQPTAIALNGFAHAYIADFTKNYLHDITGVANGTGVFSYTGVNLDTDYLVQGATAGANQNCMASATALAIGAATTAHGSGYNVWVTSNAGPANVTQGMCTFVDNGTNGTSQAGATVTVNSITPISQIGPQDSVMAVAVDANDVGWDALAPAATNNQTGEAFPNNGQGAYGTNFGFAQSNITKPTAVALDGNNNLWYANLGSNSVSVYTNPGFVTALGTNATRISPAGTAVGAGNGGYTAGGTLSAPAQIAIDPSGDVWVGNTSSSGVGYSVTELIGVAAPTYVPLSTAASVNKLGAKP